MVIIHFNTESGLQAETLNLSNPHRLQQAVWLDLLDLTVEEETLLEGFFNINIPTKTEVEEIEVSSRLYAENGTLFMTATMVAKSESPEVQTDVVTFILSDRILMTLRYTELHAFSLFKSRLLQYSKPTSAGLLIGLLEAAVDRLADILEKISHELDKTSALIFRQTERIGTAKDISYKKIIAMIGAYGDLGAKARESLMSFTRLISFLSQADNVKLSGNMKSILATIGKDVSSLSDYSAFLSTKFNFLHDATLGMITLEQNNIIKSFTVAAVLFLPPTLIASIYGMNFKHIPELEWYVGYPLAILLMVISAWLPFFYFKRKKWL
ncbi:magnesium and cobalt transport protein CorA [Legionella rubrilucens]|uniref:Magnesium transport protein CorA n=1 Tax=Legionella rubrilucens TaxID=458 RepID=A0A0W0XPW6_9GAMM|nr:magnesium/cobalt transporter CorA [Legionella rubrilucens]KTD46638.1 magnesium and cobalt transport protein CorA [Legionella rubrilucens]